MDQEKPAFMKVLLTGANGFVGSHVLDALCVRGIPTAVLLRPKSDRQFIGHRLQEVEIHPGSIEDVDSLREAMRDCTHVIHAAGATKAVRVSGFYQVNQYGTRQVIAAANQQEGRIQRVVHISSQAAGGPAIPSAPMREEDPARPVSEYGKSKLAGEHEVRGGCLSEYVILRPPGVYGPRDREFLRLFRAVGKHICPSFGGEMKLSLVYARDLAEAVVTCLTAPGAAGRTYYVAASELVTAASMAREIARQMGVWVVPLRLPVTALWPVCLLQEALSRLSGRPNILSLQKYAELRAPGWVCDSSRIGRELGFRCATTFAEGTAQTLPWYRAQGWL